MSDPFSTDLNLSERQVDKLVERVSAERYPAGAVDKAIDVLELAYSYLREKPVIEIEIRDAIQRLRRARELHEASNQDTDPATRREA